MDLALCRSGDKGNSSNVSVIARKPEYLPYLRKHLTEEVVYNYLSNIYPNSFTGGVESVKRYDWPGINGFNFCKFYSLKLDRTNIIKIWVSHLEAVVLPQFKLIHKEKLMDHT